MQHSQKCLIVVPAFNEASSVGKVIEALKNVGFNEILVVDDASQDATANVAEAYGANVLTLMERLGAWGATQTGLRYAIRKGYAAVITMDADNQHPANFCHDLLEKLHNGNANVVVGSCPERGSSMRKLAWRWIKDASGLTLRDLTSGFRAYDRLAIRRAAGWRGTLLEYQDVGVLLLLQRYGLVIADTPVDMRPRASGGSRVFYSWGVVAYYMAHTTLLSASKRMSIRPYKGPDIAPKVFL